MAEKLHLDLPFHRGAETFNFWTHGVAMLTAVAGLVWLVVRAEGALAVTANAIYGATLVALFFSSTLHHAVQTAVGDHRSGLLRRIDHVAIFLFIAGTYTPVTLLAMPTAWAWAVFGIVWGFAAIGIGVKLFAPFMPRWVTSGVYVVMGWIAVVGIKPLLDAFELQALAWLLAGGVVYTAGAVGYAMKKPDLWPRWVGFHGVWHVLVIIAAACHFVFMVRFVPVS